MNILHSLNLAAFGGTLPQLAAILIPIVVLILITVIVVVAIYSHNRRREMWHQTARLALEKGQPLPPLSEDQPPSNSRKGGDATDDIRSGLICIGAGIGIYLFLGTFLGRGLGYVGAVPGFVGVALLLFGLMRLITERKQSSNENGSRKP